LDDRAQHCPLQTARGQVGIDQPQVGDESPSIVSQSAARRPKRARAATTGGTDEQRVTGRLSFGKSFL
jgi:hypothetical protein